MNHKNDGQTGWISRRGVAQGYGTGAVALAVALSQSVLLTATAASIFYPGRPIWSHISSATALRGAE